MFSSGVRGTRASAGTGLTMSNRSGGSQKGAAGPMLELLGLDDSTIASITSLASTWVFETGDTWNCSVPSTTSLASKLVQTVTDLGAMQNNIVAFLTPMFKGYSLIRDARKRVGYKDMSALMRERVGALLMSMPLSEVDMLSVSSLPVLLDRHARPEDGMHFIIEKLLPD